MIILSIIIFDKKHNGYYPLVAFYLNSYLQLITINYVRSIFFSFVFFSPYSFSYLFILLSIPFVFLFSFLHSSIFFTSFLSFFFLSFSLYLSTNLLFVILFLSFHHSPFIFLPFFFLSFCHSSILFFYKRRMMERRIVERQKKNDEKIERKY